MVVVRCQGFSRKGLNGCLWRTAEWLNLADGRHLLVAGGQIKQTSLGKEAVQNPAEPPKAALSPPARPSRSTEFNVESEKPQFAKRLLWFWVFLVMFVFLLGAGVAIGYQVGKDLALRDIAAERVSKATK